MLRVYRNIYKWDVPINVIKSQISYLFCILSIKNIMKMKSSSKEEPQKHVFKNESLNTEGLEQSKASSSS